MKFYDNLMNKGNNAKINIFIDMDGVLAEYAFDEAEKVRGDIAGVFLNKRPLRSIIKEMEELSKNKNIELYILSICNFNDQKHEKNQWLDMYIPFIKESNRIIIIKNEEREADLGNGYLKSKYIKERLNSLTNSYIIDDDHKVLKEVKKAIPDIITVHISMLIK